MKRVLWVSRHPIDPKAVEEIKNIVKDEVEIIQHNHTFDSEPVKAFDELVNLIKVHKADAVGGVFPAQLWVALMIELAGLQMRYGDGAIARMKEIIGAPLFIVISKPVTAEDGETRRFEFDRVIWID